MNEWDRLRRQAERYKQDYPKGTRVLLLGMGNDPRPVESNTRGTVMAVDDIGTIHCKFDNGRQLGLIPGEDSFRKLTQEELQTEQAAERLKDYRERPPNCPMSMTWRASTPLRTSSATRPAATPPPWW